MPDRDGICEGSGLSLMSYRYILELLCGMGRRMVKHNIGWVYSIVDMRTSPDRFRSEQGYTDLEQLGCAGYHGCSR
jgi:hypothetical protein